MRRLLRAGWLAMMWLIAALAGGNVVYALNNDLLGLGVVGLLLAVIALGGSLLVLSSDFESNFRFETRPAPPRPAPARASFSPAPVPPAPAATPATAAPGAASSSGMIVHEAAPPSGEKQVCARCGIVLADFGDPASSGKAWAPGTWIAVANGSTRQIDMWQEPGAAQRSCTSIGA